ncbi:hypothetical protein KAU33_04310 [Candidatus Dependentiae bacterium]|nr:hypothetical protein [Candidatus Dependentiae bacterium]
MENENDAKEEKINVVVKKNNSIGLDNLAFAVFSLIFLYCGIMGMVEAHVLIDRFGGFYEKGYFDLIVSLLEIICGILGYIVFKMR